MQKFEILNDLVAPVTISKTKESALEKLELTIDTSKPDRKTKTLKAPPKLTLARLKELLNYDPETGNFTWARQSGRQKEGDPAGARAPVGYMYIGIDGERILAHRVAWFYVHGKWPEGVIDHIDEDGFNNRIANLRDVTQRQNLMNSLKKGQRRGRPNKLAPGVQKMASMPGKFSARLNYQGKGVHLGSFGTVKEAYEAYRAANKKYYGQDLPEYEDLPQCQSLKTT